VSISPHVRLASHTDLRVVAQTATSPFPTLNPLSLNSLSQRSFLCPTPAIPISSRRRCAALHTALSDQTPPLRQTLTHPTTPIPCEPQDCASNLDICPMHSQGGAPPSGIVTPSIFGRRSKVLRQAAFLALQPPPSTLARRALLVSSLLCILAYPVLYNEHRQREHPVSDHPPLAWTPAPPTSDR
jgi:hypothetical protein